jgi:uncharacterized membrane protein YgcG
MSSGGSITLRLGVKGAEEVKAALRELGPVGARALEQLEAASNKAGRATEGFGAALTAVFDRTRLGVIEEGSAKIGVFGSAIEKLGPAGLAAAAGIVVMATAFEQAMKSMEWAEDLKKASETIGVSVEKLQGFDFAAKESGIGIEAFRSALQAGNVALGAFQSGVGDAKLKKAFEGLGFTREQARTFNDVGDLLPVLADKISHLGSTAEQVKLAQAFGLEALLPLLREGSAGFEELQAQADKYGVVLDESVIKRTAAAREEMNKAHEVIDGQLRKAFIDLAPDIALATNRLAEFIGVMVQALQKFHEWEMRTTIEDRKAELAASEKELARLQQPVMPGYEKYDLPALRQPKIRKLQERIVALKGQLPDTFSSDDYPEKPGQYVSGGPAGSAGSLVTAGGGSGGGSGGGTRGPQKGDLVLMHGGPNDLEGRGYWAIFGDPDGKIVTELDAKGLKSADSSKAVDLTTNLGSDIKPGMKDPGKLDNKAWDLGQAFDANRQAFRDSFRDSFREGVHAAIDGNLGDYLKHKLADAALNMFDKALNNLADQLFAIMQSSGGGGGGGGGFLSSLFAAFSGGGGGGSGASSAGTALLNAFNGGGFAWGGQLGGRGGPRDDKIPLWGSDGEFMVNAQATARYLPFLEAINSGRALPRFALGGMIGGGRGGGMAGGVTVVFQNHAEFNAPGAAPEQLAALQDRYEDYTRREPQRFAQYFRAMAASGATG